MIFAPSEIDLWKNEKDEAHKKLDDREINEKYSRGEGRIVIETNREKLPGFVEQLKIPNYLDLRPFYQRRPRWDVRRQSLLIESFIMNIPVPPVFLYEKEYNSYEVMDGQQRITAIKDFYNNAFALKGLETWSELDGRTYKTLPEKIKAGIDRRSISSIVLLKESTESEEEASQLRETVFERLNTGGVKLERQEIRNALYRGPFNELLEDISRWDEFRKVWGLPRYVEGEVETNPDMQAFPLFTKMGDAELILRFFALRHADHYTRGMQGFLDLYQFHASKFTKDDVEVLRRLYVETFQLVLAIYGDLLFRPYNPTETAWEKNPHRAFHDAVMIGFSEHLDKAEFLVKDSENVIQATKKLFEQSPSGTFTGRGNTKSDIQQRIKGVAEMVMSIVAAG